MMLDVSVYYVYCAKFGLPMPCSRTTEHRNLLSWLYLSIADDADCNYFIVNIMMEPQ